MSDDPMDSPAGDGQPAHSLAPNVLRERARNLARPLDHRESSDDGLPVLLFQLGGEAYAVECRHVREVLRPRGLTPLPGAPPFVLGIVNVRGQILSVADLRPFLGLRPAPATAASRIAVLQAPPMEFGIIADAVLATGELSPDELEPAPPTLSGPYDHFVRGVTRDRVILLDAPAILNEPALAVDAPTRRESQRRMGDA